MKKSSSRFVINAVFAALLTFSSNCIAWFEPEYGVSDVSFLPREMMVQGVAKYPYRHLYLKLLNQIPSNSTQREMLEQLGVQGLIQVDTQGHSHGNIADDVILNFTGRIFIKNSSFFERLFARADKQKCLLEVYIGNERYIVFENTIHQVYEFVCSELD